MSDVAPLTLDAYKFEVESSARTDPKVLDTIRSLGFDSGDAAALTRPSLNERGEVGREADGEEQAIEMMQDAEIDLIREEHEDVGERLVECKEVQDLLVQGKQKGFITYDEVNDALPHDVVSSDQIDEVIALFSESKVAILDASPDIVRVAPLPSVGGKPASGVLAAFGRAMVIHFEQLCQIEVMPSFAADYSQLVALEAIRCEELVREIFLSKQHGPPIDSVEANLRVSEHRDILRAFTHQGYPPTLALVHVWVIGLRRAIEGHDPTATEWVQRRFAPESGRYVGEAKPTIEMLSERSLCKFIDVFRAQYRNPSAHGSGGVMSLAQYSRWCDFAFATQTLGQWFKVGVAPRIYSPDNIGWVSLLTNAAAEGSRTCDDCRIGLKHKRCRLKRAWSGSLSRRR